MNPKTEQILETIRALRQARAKATHGEWQSSRDLMTFEVHSKNKLICKLEDNDYGTHDDKIFSERWNDSEFITLAANKMDQLCEVLEVCVDGLMQINGTHKQFMCDDKNDCEWRATETIEKAAEILGRDKG